MRVWCCRRSKSTTPPTHRRRPHASGDPVSQADCYTVGAWPLARCLLVPLSRERQKDRIERNRKRPKDPTMTIAQKLGAWQPPESVSREETLARSAAVLAKPSLPLRQTEDIFRIHALGLDWDMGVTVYEPSDAAQIARGADGKKIGIFLLHGG